MPEERRTEIRQVRSEDPSLSDEANRLLTGELQDVVGADHVRVRADTTNHQADRHATHTSFVATLVGLRLGLVIGIGVAVVVAALLAVYTESVLVLIAALIVLGLTTVVVVFAATRLAGETEHVDPSTAARLEEEGVGDPDRVLTDLAQNFTAPGEKGTGSKPAPSRRRS